MPLSVILSVAKNPGLGGEALRFAQGDNGLLRVTMGNFAIFSVAGLFFRQDWQGRAIGVPGFCLLCCYAAVYD